MPRHPAIALVIAALLMVPRPLRAQLDNPTPLEILNTCPAADILRQDDAELPPLIAAAIADNGAKIAISSCSEWYGSHLHYFARVLSRHQNGVCEAKETEIFPGGAENTFRVAIIGGSSSAGDTVTLHDLSGTPPAAWTALGYKAKSRTVALATGGNCPSMNDARYIATIDVPDQTLKQTQAFWQETTSSPQAFDQALGDVPFEFGEYIPWIRQGQKALLGQFREKAMAAEATLHDISCRQNICKASFGFSCTRHTCWPYRWIEFGTGPQGIRPVRWGGYLVS